MQVMMFFIIFCYEDIDSRNDGRNDCLRAVSNFLLIISFIAGFLTFFGGGLFFVRLRDLPR